MTEPLDNDLELMRAAALETAKQMETMDYQTMQDNALELAREEYMHEHRKLEKREQIIRDREAQWRNIQARLGMDVTATLTHGTMLPTEISLDDILEEIKRQVTEFKKLEKMFKLINENPLLKSQWDKLVMSIRLVGGDNVD